MRTCFLSSLLAAFSLLGMGSAVGLAQNDVADPEAYREEKRRATETFLDSTRPKAARLAAAKKLRYPEPETFERLLLVGKDRSEDDEIRLAALERYLYDEKYLDTVLGILADPDDGGELLDAGLIDNISRRTTFRQPTEVRQRLQSALRERLGDARPAVRLAAYRALAASHDPAAISRLVEGLRSGAPPIPAADAIELLDVDGSAKHIVTLRPYLDDGDPAVRGQAARALALDPESRQRIVGLATDRETPVEVRAHALRALAREDEGFLQYATTLMLDGRERADIRYLAMKAAVGRMNYHELPAKTQIAFAQAVQRLSSQQGPTTTDGRDLGAEAKELFAYLLKAFPVIRRHYALR